MSSIKQNIDNLRYSIVQQTFYLSRDQQDSLLLLLENLENQLKTFEALNTKGI